MNYHPRTGELMEEDSETRHIRALLDRERRENDRLREQVREVECLTVGGVEIEVDRADAGKKEK